MKKLIYSIIVIGGFSFYVIFQSKINEEVGEHTPLTVIQPVNSTQEQITTPTTSQSITKFKDGSYTGNSADAYYGLIQVKAVIKNGRITDVVFLQYPNGQPNSIKINTQAMPILKSEAIKIQDSQVDTVSGASESSQAFRTSLASALKQAKL